MTTKEQERKALEEIKAIVEKVGGDQSYIGMAFKGCFEIAEDNILNDFGDSWMDRWSSAVDEGSNLHKQVEEYTRINAQQETELSKCRNYEEELRSQISDLERDKQQLRDGLKDYETENNDLGERNKELEYENMALKAKLYDLMTA